MKERENDCDNLCDFVECPLHLNCGRFKATIDKTLYYHWGTMPYNVERQKCSWYVNAQDLHRFQIRLLDQPPQKSPL